MRNGYIKAGYRLLESRMNIVIHFFLHLPVTKPCTEAQHRN